MDCLVVGHLLERRVLDGGGAQLTGLHFAVSPVLLLAVQYSLPQIHCLLSRQDHLKLRLLEVLIGQLDLLDVVLVRLANWNLKVPRALWQEMVDALVQLITLKHEGGFLHAF